MRVVIQRVEKASVKIEEEAERSIGKGLMILLGIEAADTQEDIDWLCGKISRLRIFDDDNGLMNHSVADINGEIMVASQFTLHASTKKGNRPSYINAAKPDLAIPLYNAFVEAMGKLMNKEIVTGEFGAMMQIALVNDGPVTITIDTKNKE